MNGEGISAVFLICSASFFAKTNIEKILASKDFPDSKEIFYRLRVMIKNRLLDNKKGLKNPFNFSSIRWKNFLSLLKSHFTSLRETSIRLSRGLSRTSFCPAIKCLKNSSFLQLLTLNPFGAGIQYLCR